MTHLTHLNDADLAQRHTELKQEFDALKAQKLNLDMTRGKPSTAQLDISNELLHYPTADDIHADNGTDVRNYGGLDGLPETKKLFSQLFDIHPQQIIIGGNSSLTLMFDTLARACLFGVDADSQPWMQSPRKMICPVPGYDRHFTVAETLGFELIPVALNDDGPDMDEVERLVAADDRIKAIWCVPKYSNPTGTCYSEETVTRLAAMTTAANDFRIFWDDAYNVHSLTADIAQVKNIFDVCVEQGNDDRPYGFASTSKITFPGAGIAAYASSPNNVKHAKKYITAQAIGPDKINQLRHARFFPDADSLHAHMQKHAGLLKPKFDRVEAILATKLDQLGIAQWTTPTGGYFISLDLLVGSAAKTIDYCNDLGVKLTNAGATFPYGNDPNDRNIRIAPSFPTLDDIEQATLALATCCKLAAIESIIAKR